jgi:hypothetical protein
MTDNITTNVSESMEAPKKKRRIFLWVFLAIQAFFIIWIISAVAADPTSECSGNCEDAATGIAVFLQIMVWMIVDFLVGVGYAIYRLAKRP